MILTGMNAMIAIVIFGQQNSALNTLDRLSQHFVPLKSLVHLISLFDYTPSLLSGVYLGSCVSAPAMACLSRAEISHEH